MKSERIALVILISLCCMSIIGEVYLYRQVNKILDSIEKSESVESIEESIQKNKRLISSMLSHEDLREVEIALCDYKSETSEINKSRLWDSVHHIKRLSFFSYFQKD